MTVNGAQLRDLLQRQLPKGDAQARLLQVSGSLRYQWGTGADGTAQLGEVLVDGRPLDAARDYRLVVNSFMAEGGDGQGALRQGRDRVSVGVDIDALAELLADNPAAVTQVEPGRILRR